MSKYLRARYIPVMDSDHVDRMRQAWAVRQPELDTTPLDVAGRLLRLATHLQRSISAALAPLGLSYGDFDILSTLRRENSWLSPSALARSVLLSSGATTARLNRLEAAGLLRRDIDRDDRRAIRVQLTEAGQQKAATAVQAVLAADEAFLEPLSQRQNADLIRAMRTLLVAAEADGVDLQHRAP